MKVFLPLLLLILPLLAVATPADKVGTITGDGSLEITVSKGTPGTVELGGNMTGITIVVKRLVGSTYVPFSAGTFDENTGDGTGGGLRYFSNTTEIQIVTSGHTVNDIAYTVGPIRNR